MRFASVCHCTHACCFHGAFFVGPMPESQALRMQQRLTFVCTESTCWCLLVLCTLEGCPFYAQLVTSSYFSLVSYLIALPRYGLVGPFR